MAAPAAHSGGGTVSTHSALGPALNVSATSVGFTHSAVGAAVSGQGPQSDPQPQHVSSTLQTPSPHPLQALDSLTALHPPGPPLSARRDLSRALEAQADQSDHAEYAHVAAATVPLHAKVVEK